MCPSTSLFTQHHLPLISTTKTNFITSIFKHRHVYKRKKRHIFTTFSHSQRYLFLTRPKLSSQNGQDNSQNVRENRVRTNSTKKKITNTEVKILGSGYKYSNNALFLYNETGNVNDDEIQKDFLEEIILQ